MPEAYDHFLLIRETGVNHSNGNIIRQTEGFHFLFSSSLYMIFSFALQCDSWPLLQEVLSPYRQCSELVKMPRTVVKLQLRWPLGVRMPSYVRCLATCSNPCPSLR
jgi:hypothetical protein